MCELLARFHTHAQDRRHVRVLQKVSWHLFPQNTLFTLATGRCDESLLQFRNADVMYYTVNLGNTYSLVSNRRRLHEIQDPHPEPSK